MPIKQACWLGFLRCASRKTLQGLAQKYGTQRSNISAFVTSDGKTRNISQDKVASILFDLGVLADGTLLPGVHCWQVEAEMISDMCDLLVLNEFEQMQIVSLKDQRCFNKAFLLAKISSNTFVLASFLYGLAEEIKLHFWNANRNIETIFLDRPAWANIYAFWMTQKNLLLQTTSCNEIKHFFVDSPAHHEKCYRNENSRHGTFV